MNCKTRVSYILTLSLSPLNSYSSMIPRFSFLNPIIMIMGRKSIEWFQLVFFDDSDVEMDLVNEEGGVVTIASAVEE